MTERWWWKRADADYQIIRSKIVRLSDKTVSRQKQKTNEKGEKDPTIPPTYPHVEEGVPACWEGTGKRDSVVLSPLHLPLQLVRIVRIHALVLSPAPELMNPRLHPDEKISFL